MSFILGAKASSFHCTTAGGVADGMNGPFEFSNRDSGAKSTLELGIRHVSGSDFTVNVRLTYGRGETRGRYRGILCLARAFSFYFGDWH